MDKILIRLWPLFNVAGMVGIAAALILFVISVLWQLGFADLTEIFPTLKPWYVMAGSIALSAVTWVKWSKTRRGVLDAKRRQES